MNHFVTNVASPKDRQQVANEDEPLDVRSIAWDDPIHPDKNLQSFAHPGPEDGGMDFEDLEFSMELFGLWGGQ